MCALDSSFFDLFIYFSAEDSQKKPEEDVIVVWR